MSSNGSVELVEVESLIPHEETIESLTKDIGEAIRRDGFVIHPIIADKKSLVVIDGMHRAAALKYLRTYMAPVYLVDYMGEEISLRSWYRTVKKTIPDKIIAEITIRNSLSTEKVSFEEGLKGLEKRRYIICLIKPREEQLTAITNENNLDIWEMYRLIAKIDNQLRVYGLSYLREVDALEKIKRGEAEMCYMVPSIRKNEIIELAKNRKLLPPKTTRHIVNNRPMFTFTPLEILNMRDREKARQLNRERLSKLRRINLPPNQVIDRLYEEPIVVYIQREEEFLKRYPDNILRLIMQEDLSP